MGAGAVLLTGVVTLSLSTRQVELNLGPGDTPFVSGFERDREVENKVGWHWTTYAAAVDLPFEANGSDLDVTLRYARMFGEEAVVDVRVGAIETERFRARGGEIRCTTLHASSVRGPLVVAIKVDSHERRNMGLRMDRLSVAAPAGAPLKLRWGAALRPVVTAALLFAGLLALGASPLVAGGFSLTGAVWFGLRAGADLFGAWREIRLAPEMLIISTLVLLAARKWMEERTSMEKQMAAWLAAAALVTMLFRLSLMSHPDFYYPDLLTHARVVDTIRNEGASFFLDPAGALNAQGAWTKPVLGTVSSLPYAVMFHTPFAVLASLFHLSIDQIEIALKAGSSLISVLPILLAAVLAARLSLPPLSALLLCVIPTYASRLSFALLPALFGHVFDLTVLLTLAMGLKEDGMRSPRSVLRLMAALLLGHLAYTSSVVNEAVFMGVLSALCLGAARSDRSVSARLVLAEAGAALCAFGLYYRHFVGDVAGLLTRVVGLGPSAPASTTSVYPIESFWSLLFERTNSFFGWPYFSLALIGLLLGGPAVARSKVVPAWILAYLALILLRARIPDIFRYGHETLFLTPLVAILAGSALILAGRRGGAWRFASLVAWLVLSLVSFRQQWRAVAEQLGNAL